jgi:hypothetical protein
MRTKVFLCAIIVSAASYSGMAAAITGQKVVNCAASDIVYDSYSQRIFAATPSSNTTYPNSIVWIDPMTGLIEGGAYVGSEPRNLAISSDGKYIYVGLDGSGKVRRFNVQTRTAELEFVLGTDPYFGTLYAEDMAVQPGNSNVLAVSLYRKGVSPRHGGVAVYDNGVKRPQQTADHTGSNVIEWSNSPQTVYGYNNETTDFGLRTMVVNEFGIATTRTTSGFGAFGIDMKYDDGRLYSTNGKIIDTATMLAAGTFAVSGSVAPDSQIRRTFYINNLTLSSWNQETFASAGSVTVSGVTGAGNKLIRWGNRGLAFIVPNKVVIVETDLVTDAPTITNMDIEGPSHLSSFSGDYLLTVSFSDGVTKDVTKAARWSVSPDTYATIDGMGLLTIGGTDQPGSVTVSAEYVWAGKTNTATKTVTYEGGVSTTAQLVSLAIEGPARVLRNSSSNYKVMAGFSDGSRHDVTSKSILSLSSTEFAAVDGNGVFTAKDVTVPVDVVLYAQFGHLGTILDAVANITCVPDAGQLTASDWPQFQANSRHTGYTPVSLEPEVFSLRWQKQIPTRSLNPVTAAGGKVYVSLYVYFDDVPGLFCLDNRDGEVLWSKSFGSVYSVNPPSYAYGRVYIQTCNHSSDTWLWAFDSESGSQTFKSASSAQWERYSAPTMYDRSVYVNGGYYGGMYGFDAMSGERKWFLGLAQEDGWTPAVSGDTAYACVGSNLTAVDRSNGVVLYNIAFPNAGYGLAAIPVIGDRNNVIAIGNGALVCFDLPNRKVAWSQTGSFSGQPALAKGVVYAINSGQLEARNEADGTLQWTWKPPEGALNGNLIVTDTHLLAHTGANTYAVEILSHNNVWSYPAAGHIALGNDTLYIAAGSGLLTAIATPEYTPAKPVSISIDGPNDVEESCTISYIGNVAYDDGRIRNRTALSTWTLEPADIAIITDKGTIAIGELLYPRQEVVLKISYTEKDMILTAQKKIGVNIAGTVKELLERNVAGAMSRKQQILVSLAQALQRERANAQILAQADSGDANLELVPAAVRDISDLTSGAISHERISERMITKSLGELDEVLTILSPEQTTVEDVNHFKAKFEKAFGHLFKDETAIDNGKPSQVSPVTLPNGKNKK